VATGGVRVPGEIMGLLFNQIRLGFSYDFMFLRSRSRPAGPVIEELGLRPHDPVDSLRDTVDSLLVWGLVRPRRGVDNYRSKAHPIEVCQKG
jgi:hypothetical protein